MASRKMAAALIVLAVAAGGYVVWAASAPPTLLIQGEVEATRIDLSPRVPGRVADVSVDFGDRVENGDLLVQLESPQLQAGLAEARAALAVAVANRDLTYSTRPETIAAREAALKKAEADLDFAQKTYDRISRLRDSAVASVQRLDEVSNTLDVAMRGREAAEAELLLARNGSSSEQKAVATAQVEQARANVSRIETDIAELAIHAPINGQVSARMAEPGKLFSAGAPVLSIVDVDNAWFTFNLREDLLDGLTIGQELRVRVPALNDRVVTARITAINVEGTYANWRATKATGDFDLRTFSVRAEPVSRVPDLRPGMSALVDRSGI
ncbi:HlyD family secretion protein [Lutimaribacter marinistellae]|uniref:HlyD family secretion protein n=1 Tax=Lutimaribacter marinistellae TaxID=1820329 RepID=A0ABV7TDG0_9RHOB